MRPWGRAHRFAFASLAGAPAPLRIRGGAPAPSPHPPLAKARALRYASGCGRYAPLGERSRPCGRSSSCRVASAPPHSAARPHGRRFHARSARACASPRLGAFVAIAARCRYAPMRRKRSRRSRRLRSSRPRVPLAARSLRSRYRLVSSRATLAPSLLALGAPGSLRSPSPTLVWSLWRGFACPAALRERFGAAPLRFRSLLPFLPLTPVGAAPRTLHLTARVFS